MKKFLCLLLTLCIVMMGTISVFGASTVSARPSNYYISRGGQVTFYLNLNTTTEVQGFGLTVVYDSNVFDYVSSSWNVSNAKLPDYDSAGQKGTVLLSESTLCGGDIFTLTLQAKSNAALGDAAVSFALKVGSDGETVYAYSSTNISCNHSYGAWKTISEATCTESGVQERKCTICGEVQKNYTPAKGHDYGDWETAKEADCTHEGQQSRKCSVCGSSQTRAIEAKGHILGDESTVISEATCTEHGKASGLCTVCGENVTIDTPFAEHAYGEWYDTKEATCTEKGMREHECTVCGHREEKESLPLGHDFTNGEVIRQANIYTTGLVEAVCSRCGEPGSIVTPCSYSDEETGIYFEADEDTFPSGSILKVSQTAEARPDDDPLVIDKVKKDVQKLINRIKQKNNAAEPIHSFETGNEELDAIMQSMSSISDEYNVYRIRAVNGDGDDIDLNGKLKITFPIPDSFSRNTAVYLMDEKGNAWNTEVEISTSEKEITLEADKLGNLVLANLDKAPDQQEGLDDIYHYMIEALLFLLMLISMIVSGSRKKKLKKANAPETTVEAEGDSEKNEETVPAEEKLQEPKPTLDDIFGKID